MPDFFVLYYIGRMGETRPHDVAITRPNAEARRDALKEWLGGFWHIWLVKLDSASVDRALWSELETAAPVCALTEAGDA